MALLFELFRTFFTIGLFTFGGGYAMISLIEDRCVENKKWITHDEMMNITIIAESTPGPIAINCATFVGSRMAGIPGALAATLGVVLPSFVIIFFISMFLDSFLEIALVARAFRGIRVAVGLLILDAGINMVKKMRRTRFSVGVALFSLSVMLCVNFLSVRITSIALMLLCGSVSLLVFMAKERMQKGGEAK